MIDISLQNEIKIGIDKNQIKYIAGNLTLNYDQVKQMIEDVLSITLQLTITDLEAWIGSAFSSEGHVPKRTGTLRQDLLHWLHGSNVYNGIMRLILKTNLEYAADVNNMTTSNVRHMGEKGYVYYPNQMGIRGPVWLDDPRAEGNFFDKLSEFAKDRIKTNLIKAKNQVLGMQGQVSRTLRREIK